MLFQFKAPKAMPLYRRINPVDATVNKMEQSLEAGDIMLVKSEVSIVYFANHLRLALEGHWLVFIEDIGTNFRQGVGDFEHLYKSYLQSPTQAGRNALTVFWQRLAPELYGLLGSRMNKSGPEIAFEPKLTLKL